ncbi:MAG: O-antigen ligase family protein [Caldilineales bacterium]
MTSHSLPLVLRRALSPAVILMPVAALLIAALPPLWSVTLLVVAAVALLISTRPWLGLLGLALVAPWAPWRPFTVGGLPLDAADLALLATLTAWLLHSLAQRQLVIPRAPLTWPLLLWLGALAVALAGAQSYREGLPELVKWVQVLLVYWLCAALLTPARARWLMAALLLSAAAQALLGVGQFVTGSGPEPFVLPGGFMRASGTFRQPNPYAGYLGLAAPVAFSLALAAGSRRRGRAVWPLLLLASAAALIALGLVVSWSRGAWLAFAAAMPVVLLLHARRAVLPVLALLLLGGLAVAIAAALGLLPAAVVNRISDLQSYFGLVDVSRVEVTDANFSVLERVAHWQAALAMWRDHLWLGVGLGNYAVSYPTYHLPRWQEALGHAHNIYLNVAAESGLLGLLAYLGVGAASFWQALRAVAAEDRWRAAAGIGVLGALIAAGVHNLFDNLWVQHIYLLPALLLGVLAVPSSSSVGSIQAFSGAFHRKD